MIQKLKNLSVILKKGTTMPQYDIHNIFLFICIFYKEWYFEFLSNKNSNSYLQLTVHYDVKFPQASVASKKSFEKN